MNKNFKCVVFDLDGTLIDSGPDLLDSLNFVLKKNNLKAISGDVIGNLVGGGAEAMIKRGYAFLGEKLDNKMLSDTLVILDSLSNIENIFPKTVKIKFEKDFLVGANLTISDLKNASFFLNSKSFFLIKS